jgi:hypothetical protein
MKQTTPDDALVGLLAAIIMQAVEDYQALQKRGAIGPCGEVLGYKFERMKGRTYAHCDGMKRSSEARDLVEFFTGWQIEFLCDAIGHQACRIRRKLGLVKEVL